jgi:hypothetical protein
MYRHSQYSVRIQEWDKQQQAGLKEAGQKLLKQHVRVKTIKTEPMSGRMTRWYKVREGVIDTVAM